MYNLTLDVLKKKHIGVLMGGTSSEREISLKTGTAIFEALSQEHFHVTAIDVGTDIIDKLCQQNIEIAFLALHGLIGEDGAIQGLLEVMRIPYTGSGVLASALAMNKIKSKEVFSARGIPTPAWKSLSKAEGTIPGVGFPVVVKPASQGSAVGVSIAQDAQTLTAMVRSAFEFDTEVLIEDYIKGVELTVGILNGKALPVIKITPQNSFYDFHSKYAPGGSIHSIPSGLPPHKEKEAQALAESAHQALGCRGASRVDIIHDAQEKFFVLEVNTIPGMTQTSLLPDAAKAAGYSFNHLVVEILKSAHLEKSGLLKNSADVDYTD